MSAVENNLNLAPNTMPDLHPEFISEAVAKGAAFLESEVTDFPKWSRVMVYQFGDQILPHLERVWLLAQEELQRRQTSPPTAPTLIQQEIFARMMAKVDHPHRHWKLPKAVLVPVYAIIVGLFLV